MVGTITTYPDRLTKGLESMIRTVSAALLAGVLTVGVIATNSDTELLAQRHSCGYHCNLDGSNATPSAPPTGPETQFVGRTNQHSGGRAGGKAQPRTGSGADHRSMGWVSFDSDAQIQFVGRTNVHSGGRTGGTANKRVGHPGGSGHPASVIITDGFWGVQPMGRTNVHSGGHNQPRNGGNQTTSSCHCH